MEVHKLQFAGAKEANSVDEGADELIRNAASNELIFAVVGHAGSGTSKVAESLKVALENADFEVFILKASEAIREWNAEQSSDIPTGIAGASAMQDLGDEMRLALGDHAAVARRLIGKVREKRAEASGQELVEGQAVMPDGRKRAYVLDSLRHPDEVKALRSLYQDAFLTIGVVCDSKVRKSRLVEKYKDDAPARVDLFMDRDADGDLEHGQLVAETFFLSDFFVDNTESRFEEEKIGAVSKSNPNWLVLDHLARLVEIVTHSKVVRPSLSETAMYHAHGARMRSACLSRQVGAALVDVNGEVVSTGCNEVPQAGGGVYDGEFGKDHRCAFHNEYCSSVREQNRIIDAVIEMFPELKNSDRDLARGRLRKSPLGGLLEFSRAVHAEMDALLAAARKGISTVGSKLFVTTFPCHYCARHIVAAGVDEVQFIEPYPKSLAMTLHDDAISSSSKNVMPSVFAAQRKSGRDVSKDDPKVRFVPFTGVAPVLYRRAFLKDRSLKNKSTGKMSIGEPTWGGSMALRRVGYVDLEAAMANV